MLDPGDRHVEPVAKKRLVRHVSNRIVIGQIGKPVFKIFLLRNVLSRRDEGFDRSLLVFDRTYCVIEKKKLAIGFLIDEYMAERLSRENALPEIFIECLIVTSRLPDARVLTYKRINSITRYVVDGLVGVGDHAVGIGNQYLVLSPLDGRFEFQQLGGPFLNSAFKSVIETPQSLV